MLQSVASPIFGRASALCKACQTRPRARKKWVFCLMEGKPEESLIVEVRMRSWRGRWLWQDKEFCSPENNSQETIGRYGSFPKWCINVHKHDSSIRKSLHSILRVISRISLQWKVKIQQVLSFESRGMAHATYKNPFEEGMKTENANHAWLSVYIILQFDGKGWRKS